jgi:16S rRNA processing protein RimM
VAGTGNRDSVLLGRIVGAHGLRGEVLLHAYTATPEDIGAYGALTDAAGRRSFAILSVRSTPKGVVARIEGVDDRTAAETLKGVELYLPRERLPAPTAEGEFYHADLIGLDALDPDGKTIGKIVAVENYGAGDLLEICLAGSGKSELIPFTEAFVPHVDVAAGHVVMIMPTLSVEEDDGHPPHAGEGDGNHDR